MLKSLGMAKLTDMDDLTIQYEDMAKEHKALIASVAKVASAANKTTNEIQGNTTAFLNGQAQFAADMEKIKEENISLRKLLREANLDDVGKGKGDEQAPLSSPRKSSA